MVEITPLMLQSALPKFLDDWAVAHRQFSIGKGGIAIEP